MEQFDRKSPKADEAVRSIKTDLADAVDTCVEAAGLETDAVWQKKLLKVWEKKSRIHPGSWQANADSKSPVLMTRLRHSVVRFWICTTRQI